MTRLLFLASLTISAPVQGQVFNYSETIEGDLSDDYTQPTILTAGLGTNTLSGALTGGSNDLDLFELVVPDGLEITAINILAFQGGLNGSFLLIQPGDQLSAPPSDNFNQPIGFSILSPGGIGSDVLPTLILPGVTSVAPFFGAETLTSGSYAGWLNETGPGSTYTLEFVAVSTVPEPSSMALLALAGLGLLKRRR